MMKIRYTSGRYGSVHVFSLLLLVQITLTLLAPPMISHDGYNYLSSAKSLFTSDFPFRYQLMREPGFPFLIWLAYQTGNVILVLALLQSVFLTITGMILFKVFTQKLELREKPTFICILLGLVAVRGYANSVLQICTIVLITSITIYYLNWLVENQNLKYKPFLIALGIGAASASVNSALMCSILGSLLVAQVLLHRSWLQILKVMSSLLIGIGSVLVPWYATIFPIDVNSQMIPSPHTSYELKYFKNSSFVDDNLIRLQSLGSLLMVYPDRAPGYPSGYSLPGKELMLFGNYWGYGKTGDCLINHGGQTEVINYVSSDIEGRCVDSWILDGQSFVSRVLIPLYLTSGIIFVLAGVVAFARKRVVMQLFVLPVATLILIYSVGGAGISRFASILPLISPLLSYWLWATLRLKRNT
jgi:hypothetical protein